MSCTSLTDKIILINTVTELQKIVKMFLQRQPQKAPLLLAYSGGLDSRVLLDCLFVLKQQNPSLSLRVMHINHGIHENSYSWQQHAERQCVSYGLDFEVKKLRILVSPGKSLEAVAREQRYQALAESMEKNMLLLTAHHQQDQAETLLLQLFRGAGVRGLAAMPEIAVFYDGFLVRPLLTVDVTMLREYARLRDLEWVEDPSNYSESFDRNYLRHNVWPILQQR